MGAHTNPMTWFKLSGGLNYCFDALQLRFAIHNAMFISKWEVCDMCMFIVAFVISNSTRFYYM